MNTHLLERVTSSGNIIKYIDGLRFIAIVSVFICHFLANHEVNFPEIKEHSYIYPFFGNGIGHTGVFLFFGISGFILSLPFLKQYVYGSRKVSIKDYFLRRLTRLEPPYIVHLVLFLFISTVLGNKSFQELFPNFLASLFYVHNIVFSEERYPLINIVLWTLEIEVQFYILAPLLSLGIFKLPKWIRRVLMLGIIVLWPLLGIDTGFHSILNYLHFFIIGFLVADLSLEYSDKIKPSYIFDILCVIAFLIFWQGNVWLEFQWLYIFILLFLTPFSIFWKKLMEFREEHSHAPQHILYWHENMQTLNPDTLMLIDDEFTTGKTCLNFIEQLLDTVVGSKIKTINFNKFEETLIFREIRYNGNNER